MDVINPGKLLSPEETATRLGVSVDTVLQYARKPREVLQAVRVLGRVAGFRPREVARYARENSGKGRPKAVRKLDCETT